MKNEDKVFWLNLARNLKRQANNWGDWNDGLTAARVLGGIAKAIEQTIQKKKDDEE